MKDETQIDEALGGLFEKAKSVEPYGEAGDFGFETRLRAALAEGQIGFSEYLARLSWRFSFAVLPIAIGIAVFLAFQQHGDLPEGIGGLVAQWSQYIPVGI